DVLQCVHRSTGPSNFDQIDFVSRPQTEVKSRIVRRLITPASFALVIQDEVARRYFDARADAVAVGSGSDQPDLQPMIAIAAFIQQQLQLLAIVVDERVQVPVVIKVSHCRSAAYSRELKIRPMPVAHIFEAAATVMTIEKFRLRVTRVGMG